MKPIIKIILLIDLILISNIYCTKTKTSTATSMGIGAMNFNKFKKNAYSNSLKETENLLNRSKNQFQKKESFKIMQKNQNFLKKNSQALDEENNLLNQFNNKNENEYSENTENNNNEIEDNANNENENNENKEINSNESSPKNFEEEENSEENNSSNNNNNFLYKGWQQISSKLFDNENIFPKVIAKNASGNFRPEKIKIDREFFRINSNKKISPHTDREFHFKMNQNKLYYSTDPSDLNILQVFYFSRIYKLEELPIKFLKDKTKLSCFEIIEKATRFRYKFCNLDRLESLKFMCLIAKKLKYFMTSCESPDKSEGIEQNTIIKKEIIDATIVIPKPAKFVNENWNYDNHGEDWEGKCKEGSMQSPIDLPDLEKVIYSPVTPLFKFDEIEAKVPVTTVEGEYIENGNIKIKYMNGAIRVLHPNLGKIVTLNGNVYIAEEITVHTPSEHLKEGKRFDMEIQFIFYGVSKGDIAKQVVLSFLFEKKAGFYNKFVDDLDFYSLPNQKDPEKFILNNLFIPRIFHSVTGDNDSEDVISLKPFSFYTYEGSLTMPPCSEDTIHYIAAETIPIGSVVLELAYEALRVPDIKRDDSEGLSTIIKDNTLVENYRNVQEMNHRRVFYFDHKKYCDEIETFVTNSEKKGDHYEKIPRKVITHIFVPGMHPSGIPGSFVESKKEAYGIVDPEEKKNDKEKNI